MAERLKNLNKFDKIFKFRYSSYLPYMSLFFCIEQKKDNYFIFQEIQSPSIRHIKYIKKNNSMVLTISSPSKEYYKYNLITQRNEEMENWDDFLDRSSPVNCDCFDIILNNTIKNNFWIYKNRNDGIEKTLFSNYQEIFLKDIKKVKLYEQHFEILTNTINLIGIHMEKMFPYLVEKEGEMENEKDNELFYIHNMNERKPIFNNLKFSLKNKIIQDIEYKNINELSCNEQRNLQRDTSGDIFYSYWEFGKNEDNADEEKDPNKLCDEQIEESLHGKEEKFKPIDMGLNKNNIIID